MTACDGVAGGVTSGLTNGVTDGRGLQPAKVHDLPRFEAVFFDSFAKVQDEVGNFAEIAHFRSSQLHFCNSPAQNRLIYVSCNALLHDAAFRTAPPHRIRTSFIPDRIRSRPPHRCDRLHPAPFPSNLHIIGHVGLLQDSALIQQFIEGIRLIEQFLDPKGGGA